MPMAGPGVWTGLALAEHTGQDRERRGLALPEKGPALLDAAPGCDAPGVGNVATVVFVVVVVCVVVAFLRRKGGGIVARRGLSIGADLGTMADKPRVRVKSLIKAGPDSYRVVLTPEADSAADLDFVISLSEEDFGFDLLHQWRRCESLLALVVPPNSRLVRLRSIDDLQPITLTRIDQS